MTKIEELRAAYAAATEPLPLSIEGEGKTTHAYVKEQNKKEAEVHLAALMYNNLPALLEAAEALTFVSLVIDGGGQADEGSACDVMRKALEKLK